MRLRKILSILLVSAMCVSLMPVSAFAAQSGGDVGETNPSGGVTPGGEDLTPGGGVTPGGDDVTPGGGVTPGGEDLTPGGGVTPGGEDLTPGGGTKVDGDPDKIKEDKEKGGNEGEIINETTTPGKDIITDGGDVNYNTTDVKLQQAVVENVESSDPDRPEDTWVNIVATVESVLRAMGFNIDAVMDGNTVFTGRYNPGPNYDEDGNFIAEVHEKWGGDGNNTGTVNVNIFRPIPEGADISLWMTAYSDINGSTLPSGIDSNKLQGVLPPVGESVILKAEDPKPDPGDKNDTPDTPGDANSTTQKSSSSGGKDDLPAVVNNGGGAVYNPGTGKGGNFKPGKKYDGVVIEFRPADSIKNIAGGGVNAGVGVDQGGSGFGPYNFTSDGFPVTGDGIFNATITTGGGRYKHIGGGIYQPEGPYNMEFVYDDGGKVYEASGKPYSPGLYTIEAVDEDGKKCRVYVPVYPSSDLFVLSGKPLYKDENASTMPKEGGDLKPGKSYDCVIVSGPEIINGTDTSTGGIPASFMVATDGTKAFTDREHAAGTYMITYLDENGKSAFDYITVSPKGGSGGSGAPGDSGAGAVIPGAGSSGDMNLTVTSAPSSNIDEFECKILEYFAGGDTASGGVSMGGEKATFVRTGAAAGYFSDGVFRLDGVYKVEYVDYDGQTKNAVITVGKGKNPVSAILDMNPTLGLILDLNLPNER